jgi:hypothetical protein
MSTGRRIVRCLNADCGLTIAWMPADSEDNECPCYDVTPRDGTECLVFSDAFITQLAKYMGPTWVFHGQRGNHLAHL